MTLGGRKRQLSVLIDCMLGDAYPSEARELGQWLMELGHMIIMSETSSIVTLEQSTENKIQQVDFSEVDRDIPPDKLN